MEQEHTTGRNRSRARRRPRSHTVSVECFLLCDSAEIVRDKLYILGGGVDAIYFTDPDESVDERRSRRMFTVVGRVAAPRNAAGSDIELQLDGFGPDGAPVLPPLELALQFSQPQPLLPGGSPVYAMFAIEVTRLREIQEGVYRFTLSAKGRQLAETSVSLVVLEFLEEEEDAIAEVEDRPSITEEN